MPDLHHVLVPVDFHHHSHALADLALDMAEKLGAAGVTFLHVLPRLPDVSDYKPDTFEQLEAGFLTRAEGRMTAFLGPLRNRGKGVTGTVVGGETSEAIIDYARDHGFDLIVIATHGAQGIEKVLLGSVADRVIKGAPCPVLVFNPFRKERGYEVCKPLGSCVQSV